MDHGYEQCNAMQDIREIESWEIVDQTQTPRYIFVGPKAHHSSFDDDQLM